MSCGRRDLEQLCCACEIQLQVFLDDAIFITEDDAIFITCHYEGQRMNYEGADELRGSTTTSPLRASG